MKVLLIEDSPDVRLLLELELGQQGFEVKGAGSAAQALESVRRERPGVVVADLGLPDMDGRMLLPRLRAAALTHTPAVAMSGFGSWRDVETALAAGYDAVVVKPVAIELLVKTIAEAHRARAHAHVVGEQR